MGKQTQMEFSKALKKKAKEERAREQLLAKMDRWILAKI